jgi:hypothetical protein
VSAGFPLHIIDGVKVNLSGGHVYEISALVYHSSPDNVKKQCALISDATALL